MSNLLCKLISLSVVFFISMSSVDVIAKNKTRHVALSPGQVRVLDIKSVERVAIGNEDVVNYRISEDDELVLIGVKPGETSLYLWRKGGRQEIIYAKVSAGNIYRNLSNARRLVESMPGIKVSRLDDYILFEGAVSQSKYELLKQIVSQLPGGVLLAEPSSYDEQPMVRMDVHLLEVNRSDLSDIGIRWSDTIAGPAGAMDYNIIKSDLFGVASQDPNGAIGDEELSLLSSNDSNFYGFLGITSTIVSQISLIQETGAGALLASPKLVAVSGSDARFVAGGEFPIPTVNAVGAADVDFKEYGIILNIKPIVSGNGILAEVHAEVSTIDFAVAVNGIPGLQTRDTSTVINMQDGETLAISGLAAITDSKSVTKLPVLGDIPILSPLFRATNKRLEQRELIILVTPRLIEPGDSIDQPLQDIVNQYSKPLLEKTTNAPALME